MKRSVLAFLVLLFASAAAAQGVSPAQMGVTPTTTPEVLQVLDKNNAWVPIGSFPPGGPFTVFGGGGGGGTSLVSVFANHAALLLGSTAPTAVSGVFPTLYQQRFYAAIEGGDVAYNWSATSTCPAGVAAAGDTVTCLLPPGQSSATPGRWLISGGTRLNAIQLGFRTDGGDNLPLVKTLMGAIGAPSVYLGGFDVVFGGTKGKNPTGYYFSQPFELSRGANFRCEGGVQAAYASVRFVFPAGVNGVIEADGSMSSDGGGFAGRLSGCGVAAIGVGSGATGPGKTTIGNLGANGDVSGVGAVTPWTAGDGIIVVPNNNDKTNVPSATPAVQSGAYISGYDGPSNTLTLAAPFSISNNLQYAYQAFYQASTNNFAANDQMTVGANTFTFVTGAPTANQIKIGANFSATAASLASAIMTGVADPSAVPQWGAPSPAPTVKAYNNGTNMTFGSKVGGSAGRGPATYTPIGTPAGSFDAVFTENVGTAFVNGDHITIGNTIYNFKSGALSAAGDVKIVTGNTPDVNWALTMYNLLPALSGGCGGVSDCVNPSPASNAASDGQLQIWPIGRFVAFHSKVGSGVTTAATANTAGSWMAASFNANGTTFYGDNLWYSTTTPNVTTLQLPVAQKYVVTTTASSPTITVVSGPCLTGTGSCPAGSTARGLRNGDWIWSPDFVYGATITYRNQSGGPNNYTVEDAFMESSINATTTHTSYLWVIPSGIKREVNSINEGNIVTGFGQGLNMSCAAHDGIICTGAVDKDNAYTNNLIARDTGGDNTGGSKSDTEEFAHNWVTDIFEGARVGSTYISPNSNSVDNSGGGAYSMIGNCNATNYSVIVGGYLGGVNSAIPYCATGAGIMPVTAGGSAPLFIGEISSSQVPQGAAGIGVGLFGSGSLFGPWNFQGTGKGNCIRIGDDFTMSNAGCGSPSNFTWSWNYLPYINPNAWVLNHFSGQYQPVELIGSLNNSPNPYVGYAGPSLTSAIFPFGVVMNSLEDGVSNFITGGRNISMGVNPPNNAHHLRGDFGVNIGTSPGGTAGWSDAYTGVSTTLSGNVTGGSTTSIGVALCPSPAFAANAAWVVDTSQTPNVGLGTVTSCTPAGSAGTLTFSSAAINNGVSGETIQFMQALPAAPIAKDPAGTNWALGSFLSLTPVAIASLPACPGSSGMFAVVNNGAAPTYLGVVGTTGAVISPVFCDNVSWKYH